MMETLRNLFKGHMSDKDLLRSHDCGVKEYFINGGVYVYYKDFLLRVSYEEAIDHVLEYSDSIDSLLANTQFLR